MYVDGQYCAQILANSITNCMTSRVWRDPLSTRFELAAAVSRAGVTSAVCMPTLIGCRRRHRLIIAAAEAAITTANVTHRAHMACFFSICCV